MRTKVAVFCERVIEAGWLLALIIPPLFFSVYTNRVFEPDKLTLLRSIATLMALAWLIKWAEEPREAKGSERSSGDRLAFLREPLVMPTLLLVIAYLLATVFSIAPRLSLWGSYQRLQGTYTTLSYIVIFSLLLQSLRREEQLRRIWTTIVLTSLPIALYGLIQHYRLDPMPWGGDVTFRVASTMGNAIFIGAYLIMVIPLTLARVIHLQTTVLQGADAKQRLGFGIFFWVVLLAQMWAWVALGFHRGLIAGLLMIMMFVLAAAYFRRPLARFILLGVYGLIFSVQFTCLIFSQSRGPLLGLLGGMFFLGLLFFFVRRWRRMVQIFVLLTILGLLFLVVMNVPHSSLEPIRNIPYIGRLGRVFEIEGGTGKVRVLIWEGVVDMIKADPARAIIGYGPETMFVAYNPFYPPELAHYEARNASPDRSHNETFDSLITTGIIGFVAYILLFGSIFYYGLCWLGLVPDARWRRAFFWSGAGGILVGVFVPFLLDGSWRFAGVGLALGLVAGVALYTLVSVWKRLASQLPAPSLTGWPLLLFIATLAAIIAHFIEINFGISISATKTRIFGFTEHSSFCWEEGFSLNLPEKRKDRRKSLLSRSGARFERRESVNKRNLDLLLVFLNLFGCSSWHFLSLEGSSLSPWPGISRQTLWG